MSLRVTILSVLCFGLLSTGCFRKRAPDTMAETFVFEDNELCVTTRAKKSDQTKVVKCFGEKGPVVLADAPKPEPVVPGAVQKGDGFACLLNEIGQVFCWGRNDLGQLGDGTRDARSKPVMVTGLPRVDWLAVGAAHVCVSPNDRTIRCWGGNQYGQLADGTDKPNPIHHMISGMFDVAELRANGNSTCARTEDKHHTIRCWGQNNVGQLGDNTTLDRRVPVYVKL